LFPVYASISEYLPNSPFAAQILFFSHYITAHIIKMHDEKDTIQRLEVHNDHHEELHAHGFALESEELPRGYFRTLGFIGTFFAVGMNLASSTAGFALVAPVLGQIDVALGPSASITWLAYVYTICLAIGLLLVGRLSDLFGRRYFFVVGTALGVVGAIIGSTAKTIPVLIGGQTLIGLSACTGYSYAFVIGEIVPIKYRFLANAVVFAFSVPTAGFGAAVSEAFILYTTAGWRWVYYLLIILNGVACALYAIFYFPPTFEEKHDGRVLEWIKNFDYVGMVRT
jgi:MFS family permease